MKEGLGNRLFCLGQRSDDPLPISGLPVNANPAGVGIIIELFFDVSVFASDPLNAIAEGKIRRYDSHRLQVHHTRCEAENRGKKVANSDF